MDENREAIWLLGGGGHAKVLIDTIRAGRQYVAAGILDDDVTRHGTSLDGVPIVDSITTAAVTRLGIRRAIITIGDNADRTAVAHRMFGRVGWGTVIHPHAYVGSDVVVGEGSMVLAGVVVQPGARIGRHVILNTSASVDHGNQLGNFVHIAPGAHLGGDVTIGEGALIGIGSAVVNGHSVGAWATLGAGAVAVSDIPDDVLAIGVPARWSSRAAALGHADRE